MLFVVFVFYAVLSGVISDVPLQRSVPEKTESRIHGGVDAPKGYAPHMVALLTAEHRLRVICGGSIVSKRHVLTAAHCITPFVQNDKLSPTFHGRVGSNIWHSGGILVHFQAYFIHPKWDEQIIKYDVGILCLTRKLKLNHKVAIIALNFQWVEGNERSYVTGWGTTWPRFDDHWVSVAPTPDELQLLYVKTLTPQECERGIHSNHVWASIAPPLNPKVEICTFHSVGFGMCHGDSGSALVSVKSGQQSGIVSWGMPCAVGAPDVHTRLYGVKDFIKRVLKSCSCFNLSGSA